MDNSPEAVKGRVRSMTKSIRYKAKKEGNLIKAFNDFMGSQSGISATERSAVKKSLGLSENKWRTPKSDWRTELHEIAPMVDKDGEKTIKEKKIKNKIVINPTMGMKEAIEEIGGTIMEMVEVEEEMSPKELQLQKRKTMIDMQVARERRKQISKAGSESPTKAVGEGYAPGDVDKPVGAVTSIPKKDQDAARARILAKAKAKREAKMKEDTCLNFDDYMDEAMKPGPRQRRMADKRFQQYRKGGGTYSPQDRANAHNIAVRNDGPGTPGYEKKSTGGKGARYPGYGDQGAGNKSRRRQNLEPLRGNTRKEEFTSEKFDMKNAPSIKDAKPAKKTNVKNYPGLGIAPTIKKEETEDSLRDKRMERGGVDGNVDYRRPLKNINNTSTDKKPSKMRAVDKVRDDIIKRYGKGALYNKK